jgi:hypothetical protein
LESAVLLGQLGSATDNVERLTQAVREVRCSRHLTTAEDDLRGR